MSNLSEKPTTQMIETISNDASSQAQLSLTIPVDDLEAAIKSRVQKENSSWAVNNISIRIDISKIENSVSVTSSWLERENSVLVKQNKSDDGIEDAPSQLEKTDIDKLVDAMKLEYQSLMDTDDVPTYRHPLLSENSFLYRPQVVSIGPTHSHSRHDDLQHAEKTKWSYLIKVVNYDNATIFTECVHRVKGMESMIRGMRNDEEFCFSHDEIVKVLLLDSFFIIKLVFEEYRGDERSALMTYISDLLLFENQIPYKVLKGVWETAHAVIDKHGKYPKDTKLISVFKGCSMFWNEDLSQDSWAEKDIINVLDLYYKWNVPIPERVSKLHSRPQQLWFRSCRPQKDEKGTTQRTMIPSAVELYETGIKFRAKTTYSNIFDVSFENGILHIPTLIIDSKNMSLIANLLIHEIANTNIIPKTRVKPVFIPKYVASFIFLMDSLINTKKDIALLQKCGVINNRLATEEEAAKLFNSLGARCGVDVQDNFYASVIEDMIDYSESSWHRNYTSLMHTYFNSPWTGISVFAAVLLLFLSCAQTYYTVFPKK